MKHNLMTTCAAILLGTTAASAYTLTNGGEQGDIRANVGAYGQSSDIYFDPIGSVGGGATTYYSSVYISQGDSLSSLSSVADAATVVSESDTEVVTRFRINQLEFTLTQNVADTQSVGERVGSVLTQDFQIRNLTDAPVSFDLYRYFDGDLYLTDESLEDGGGVVGTGAGMVLYETDILNGQTSDDTFVGINAVGGTIPTSGRFAVANCCDVPAPLNDAVAGDTNGDGATDSAYDVTLNLRNDFTVGAGETTSYTTQTIFGTSDQLVVVTPGGGTGGGEPTAGDSEGNPILPTEVLASGAYSFEIDARDLEFVEETPGSEIFWIDPVVAVGYEYTVTGAAFYSVTAPSLLSVPDTDGYTLSYNGVSVFLASGATHVFDAVVSSFTITGIDAGLSLDPANTLAYPTGISLTRIIDTTAVITQTPIELNTDTPAPVPLPASQLLLLSGLLGLGALRRRASA